MGRINVYFSDELEKKLRFKAVERFGGRKGDCPGPSKKP
jgi:hypothetical protein